MRSLLAAMPCSPVIRHCILQRTLAPFFAFLPYRLPLSLPVLDGVKRKAVALVDKDGRTVAVLRDPEIYEHRKEEIITRCFGVIDPGHPYIQHIMASGPWLIGGEVACACHLLPFWMGGRVGAPSTSSYSSVVVVVQPRLFRSHHCPSP